MAYSAQKRLAGTDMDALAFFIILSAAELAAIIFLARGIWRITSKKQSLSTRYGQIFEQMVPFSREFPFDPKAFRFIGDPIDGVAFKDDEIVFCEIKLNNSELSGKQKRIKNLVEQKKVRWQEIRGK